MPKSRCSCQVVLDQDVGVLDPGFVHPVEDMHVGDQGLRGWIVLRDSDGGCEGEKGCRYGRAKHCSILQGVFVNHPVLHDQREARLGLAADARVDGEGGERAALLAEVRDRLRPLLADPVAAE